MPSADEDECLGLRQEILAPTSRRDVGGEINKGAEREGGEGREREIGDSRMSREAGKNRGMERGGDGREGRMGKRKEL